ncbi:ABC transporter permease [Thermocatellispora tengchongensis]|uniref:ABC transporter permease n=1 Tax=Thermocatellispora tengchongensis TaxID=1073253 RepID=UPI003627B830
MSDIRPVGPAHPETEQDAPADAQVTAVGVPEAPPLQERPEQPDAVPVKPKGRRDKPASLWSDAWYDLRRRPLFLGASVLIAVLLVMAIFPQLFTSIDPYDAKTCVLANARQDISAAHWFGTDNQGCDVYARTIYGARNSIVVGVSTTVVTALVGGLLGLIAGFRSGATDTLLSRTTEIFFAIPRSWARCSSWPCSAPATCGRSCWRWPYWPGR